MAEKSSLAAMRLSFSAKTSIEISLTQWADYNGRMISLARRVFPLFAALVTLIAPGAHAQTPLANSFEGANPPVILISIDAFRPDFLNRGLTPTLSRLAVEGVVAPQGMRPAFPALTFPSHYTMVTGLNPDHHGIVNNTMTDAAIPGVIFSLGNRAAVQDRRWWDAATPIWVSAEQQGLRTATLFWPGSEAAIQGVRPSDWREFDSNISMDARVDEVLTWLDRPLATRPAFITLYFDAVDTAGHRHGPDAEQTSAAIRSVDAAIKRLREGLDARGRLTSTNLVIVADHGMAATSPQRLVWLDEIIDIDAVERVGNGGPLLGLTPLPGKEAEVSRALMMPHAHMQCWPKAGLPARFDYGRNPRVPPIVCLADTGWWLTSHALFERNPPTGGVSGGAHGFDPDDPLMAALFIAHGPAFRAGQRLRRFNTVDVYPLLARLLGIKPLANQGNLATFSNALIPSGLPTLKSAEGK